MGFDGLRTADEALNKVRSLQKAHPIDLEDACAVEREKSGKVHFKQAVNLAATGAASGGMWGAMWGTLVGLLFLNPLAGLTSGGMESAGSGAVSGSLIDFGINDGFIKKLGETIPPGTSALFVLVKSATEGKVLPETEPYRPRILKTSLSSEAEEKLKAALRKVVEDNAGADGESSLRNYVGTANVTEATIPERLGGTGVIDKGARAQRLQDQPWEVDGVFIDREHLQGAVSALIAAGFEHARMTATLERRGGGGGRVSVTDVPSTGATQTGERQVRTLATSLAGAVGALAAVGVTIMTGGAAAAAVAAAALIGGSAASGVHVYKTQLGFDGEVPGEDVILSVRVNGLDEEKRVCLIFEQHDAQKIWAMAQDRH